MSELLGSLHKAGKIDKDMVTTVNDYIAQNQLNTALITSPNTVSMAVQNSGSTCLYAIHSY